MVAGCVAQAEGRKIGAASRRSISSSGRRTIIVCRKLLKAALRGRHRVSARGQVRSSAAEPAGGRAALAASAPSSRCRKAATSSARSASCPTPAAPRRRGRSARFCAEIEQLARAGAREFTLIGQNVNAYHGRGESGRRGQSGRSAGGGARIPGVLRLRYSTSHPSDMSDDLIRAHAQIDALAPYLHLPVQSGSDRILAAMNRRHRVRDYLDIVARVRRARPDIAFSSDFIVGFPGETDADFEATLALAREVGFASAYAFKYSPRPGTPAAEARSRSRRRSRRRVSARIAAIAGGAAPGVQSRHGRPTVRRHLRQARPPCRSTHRPHALYAVGARRRGNLRAWAS